jgi:hypothetical protein
MRSFRFWLAAVFVGVTVSGCAGGGGTAASTSSSSSSTAVASASGSAQDVLRTVALKSDDLPANATLKLLEDGDQVAGQVTLDLCGASFPSEHLRTARLQQVAKDASGVTVVNDENVMYQSAEGAVQALTELRKTISACDPSKFMHSHVSDVPDLRYELIPIAEAELAGLTRDHVAFTAKLTAQNGQTATEALVYQRRGAVLVGVYSPNAQQLVPLARRAATRLAALSPAEARE